MSLITSSGHLALYEIDGESKNPTEYKWKNKRLQSYGVYSSTSYGEEFIKVDMKEFEEKIKTDKQFAVAIAKLFRHHNQSGKIDVMKPA